MMMLQDDQISGTLHLIMPEASFENDGSTAADILGPLGGPLLGDDDDGGADAFVPNFFLGEDDLRRDEIRTRREHAVRTRNQL